MSEAETGERTLQVAEIADIMALLPHRYPFLMIDRVIDINGDESCVGIKNVTYNEPFFQGHFPAAPVMPGVLLIEAMAQTAGVLCVYSQKNLKPKLVYFMTIDNAKFRKPVVPGDVVYLYITKPKQRRMIWKFNGVAMVAGQKVAEAEVSAMIVED